MASGLAWRWSLAMGLSLSAISLADPASPVNSPDPNSSYSLSSSDRSPAAFSGRESTSGVVGGRWGVDQAVADLDPLVVAMRRVEPGIKTDDGEQTLLYAVYSSDMPSALYPVMKHGQRTPLPVYYRLGPGFRVKMDRMEYLIPIDRRHYQANIAPKQDGRFIEMPSANMVFDLRPPLSPFPPLSSLPPLSRPSSCPASDGNRYSDPTGKISASVAGQVNPGPIDGRVHGAVNAAVDGRR